METIHQVVQVGSDRQIQITLPETIKPGLVEVVIVVQSISTQLNPTGDAASATASLCPQENPPRIAGLHLGAISTSDDFDELLPDEF